MVGLKNLGCGGGKVRRGRSEGPFFSRSCTMVVYCLEERQGEMAVWQFVFLGSLVGFFHVAASCSDDDDDDGLSKHFCGWKIHVFLPKQW